MTDAATFSPTRRAFLRGRPRVDLPLRPPWALDETAFLNTCNGCGDCISACPEHVLARGDGDYPTFDPSLGECLFCEDCVTACEPGALSTTHRDRPWHVTAAIAPSCLAKNGVTCFSCRDACGEAAILFRPARGGAVPELDVSRCTGCGACVSPCPVSAITLSAAEADHG